MNNKGSFAGIVAVLGTVTTPESAAISAPKRHRAPNRPIVEYCAQCGEMLRAQIGHSVVKMGGTEKKIHVGCVAEALLDGASFISTHRFKKEL
jgi:hypothetical protein